jgi:hypothetical protein
MGLAFGPWGSAVGAAIGGVVGAAVAKKIVGGVDLAALENANMETALESERD